jgi:hypothetical protein
MKHGIARLALLLSVSALPAVAAKGIERDTRGHQGAQAGDAVVEETVSRFVGEVRALLRA